MDSGCRRCSRHGSPLPSAPGTGDQRPPLPALLRHSRPRLLKHCEKAARRSLCECVRGVRAPAAPSRAAGVTAPLNGWRACPSARRPMESRLISRGVLWRCPGCMALCGAAFRGRCGGGAPLRAAPRSGPAARCPPARRPRRGECALPAAPHREAGRRTETGSGRQGEGYPRPTLCTPAAGQRPGPPLSPRGVGGREGGAELPVPCATGAAAPSHFSSLSSALPWFESLGRGETGGLVLPALCPAGRAGVTGGVLPGRGEANCHTAQCI